MQNFIYLVQVGDPVTRSVKNYFVESLSELIDYGKTSQNPISFSKVDRIPSEISSSEKE